MDSWKKHAACLGLDTTPFMEDDQAAIAICTECLVRTQCLRMAINTDATGVWGGTTTEQRSVFRQKPYLLDGEIQVIWEIID